ncbi:hypothetical protein EG68_11825 [Paragonimus skrjabini miyazakii]|uniref:Uncharacterized protein n=1 Tax=Paragonimus skrjabini miyazakii TaxID=59628 RepID=A0A8S9YK44_9TREM|nr:hypothetical protein EG68_11825 [Paragonimus skrjabini miyazakii]
MQNYTPCHMACSNPPSVETKLVKAYMSQSTKTPVLHWHDDQLAHELSPASHAYSKKLFVQIQFPAASQQYVGKLAIQERRLMTLYPFLLTTNHAHCPDPVHDAVVLLHGDRHHRQPFKDLQLTDFPDLSRYNDVAQMLGVENYHVHEGLPYCKAHFKQLSTN